MKKNSPRHSHRRSPGDVETTRRGCLVGPRAASLPLRPRRAARTPRHPPVRTTRRPRSPGDTVT